MKVYNAIELRYIVQRLVGGYIEPVGNAEYDKGAYERQKTIQNLINMLTNDIIDVAGCIGRQASINKAHDQAVKWINYQKDYLEDILENVSEEEGAEV